MGKILGGIMWIATIVAIVLAIVFVSGFIFDEMKKRKLTVITIMDKIVNPILEVIGLVVNTIIDIKNFVVGVYNYFRYKNYKEVIKSMRD